MINYFVETCTEVELQNGNGFAPFVAGWPLNRQQSARVAARNSRNDRAPTVNVAFGPTVPVLFALPVCSRNTVRHENVTCPPSTSTHQMLKDDVAHAFTRPANPRYERPGKIF
jgi:hypothetical protein